MINHYCLREIEIFDINNDDARRTALFSRGEQTTTAGKRKKNTLEKRQKQSAQQSFRPEQPCTSCVASSLTCNPNKNATFQHHNNNGTQPSPRGVTWLYVVCHQFSPHFEDERVVVDRWVSRFIVAPLPFLVKDGLGPRLLFLFLRLVLFFVVLRTTTEIIQRGLVKYERTHAPPATGRKQTSAKRLSGTPAVGM